MRPLLILLVFVTLGCTNVQEPIDFQSESIEPQSNTNSNLNSVSTNATSSDYFVTTWKTDNPGVSNNSSIIVPMVGGPYDVDWNNDGIFDEFGLSGTVEHDFGSAGIYTIQIRGNYRGIYFFNSNDKDKIISLDQWGTQPWTFMRNAFWGCSNLQTPATDTPDFSALTDMDYMFKDAPLANPNTSGWDTSSVQNMNYMFSGAISANPDTSNWNTSAVKQMVSMFQGAVSANPDTSGWDTSSVTHMDDMFNGATSANPDTSGWNTSSVTKMNSMFEGAVSANPDTSNWDVSSVTTMESMFRGATSANPNTSNWNTSSVQIMQSMFREATLANPDTSNWDTSAVTGMNYMFYQASVANPDTSNWDVSSVTGMRFLFAYATLANPDVSSWNTSSVTNTRNMFQFSAANPDVSGWDMSKVYDALFMFYGVTLSQENYEALLINWSSQTLKPGVNFHGGNSTYCSQAAANARSKIINSFGWTITDGGQDCSEPVDNTPPTVNWLKTPQAFEDNTITMEVSALDSESGIQKIEWHRSSTGFPDQFISADFSSPYLISFNSWTIPDGSYEFYVKAYDNAGNITTSSPVATVVDNNAPTTPSNVEASALSNSQIQVSWNASTDAGSGVASYTVYRNGSLLQSVSSLNFQDTGLQGSTQYCYSIQAKDKTGKLSDMSAQSCATTSAPVVNNPPIATFTYSCTNLTCSFNGSGSSDSDGSIQHYQWGASDGMQKSGASISHTFASPGNYNVQLTVTDNDGAQDQELKTITVSEPPPVDNPPSVTITSPTNGATVSGTVLIQATATDDNGIASVKFYINGTLVKTDTSSPYNFSWDTTQEVNGSNSLQAVAYDSANQAASASLSVNVNNVSEPPADTEKPSVSITSPADGAVISGGSRLTLAASASDNVSVSTVRFYVDGSLICTDSSAAFSCSWRMPKAKNKSYRIQAVATDSSGNQSSDVINISSGGSSDSGGKPGGGGDKPCRGKKCQ